MDQYTEPKNIILGIFDGENMTDANGILHFIPPNYISKSKLVEGDELKLNIYNDGAFIFKQINPVARKRLKGVVTDDMKVNAEGNDYRINYSSLTFFHAKPGNEAVILVPANGLAIWAALENIVRDEEY